LHPRPSPKTSRTGCVGDGTVCTFSYVPGASAMVPVGGAKMRPQKSTGSALEEKLTSTPFPRALAENVPSAGVRSIRVPAPM
jgi:hypothetical protein